MGSKNKGSQPMIPKSAPKFSIERLGEKCQRLFGVGAAEFAGATHGKTGRYTVEEMRDIIKEWKEQEVK